MLSEPHIEAISLESIRSHPERYNSNNDRTNGRPDDYFEMSLKTQTSNWIDQFHPSYRIIKVVAPWLGRAAVCQTRLDTGHASIRTSSGVY